MLFLLLRAVLAGVWTASLVLQTVKTDFLFYNITPIGLVSFYPVA